MAKVPNWSPDELAVIDRHVRKIGRGHPDALAAARACLDELEQVWKSRPRSRRTLLGVHQKVLGQAKVRGVCWTKHSWTREEVRLVEPFVRAYLQGDYPSVRAAAQACYAGLPKNVRARRASYSIYQLLFKLARQRGLRRFNRLPDERENKALDRYVCALHEGRYKYVRQAAPDCRAELERLRRHRPDAEEVRQRTLTWVGSTLAKRSAALGLPRYRNFLTPVERALLERFARRVDRGELRDWLTAARECLAEIRRRYAQPSRLRPGGPRRLTSHSIHTVHTEILDLAHRLNLRGPRCIRWSAEETKLLEGWLHWLSRYRHVKRLHPMRQASEGLPEDLAKIGSNRTLSACRFRLTQYLNRRLGPA
jgi:hypothetical protein